MANYRAWFECFNGCGERYPIDEIVYECRGCSGLLDVVHDVNALGQRSAADWRGTFEERLRGRNPLDRSGVWSKREWVLPEIDPAAVVTFGEGRSALLDVRPRGESCLEALGSVDLFVKQCGVSQTGSFKDLGMTVLVSAVAAMRRAGKSMPAIACASTGDTSAALAAYAARAGIPAVVLLPKARVSTAQLLQPLSHGARVLSLDADFDGCMRIVRELARNKDVYLANSMNSLRLEGQKTVAIEIVEDLGFQAPDWIVVPGGNLGNVYALYKGLALLHTLGLIDRVPRLAVAQAERANPLYRAFQEGFDRFAPVTARRTAASAIQIGDPVSIHRAIRALKATAGVVEEASEAELAEASAAADRVGLYACPHTGVALAAAEKLVRAGTIERGSRVVVVSTAHGLKFNEFKLGYHDSRLEDVVSQDANRPIELPADLGRVRAALRA